MISIGKLPFFIGVLDPDEEVPTPSALPFALSVDRNLAIPVLEVTQEILQALSSAYTYGSMASTPLGESSLSTERMEEPLRCILDLFSGSVEGRHFLELGCGTGRLMNEFKRLGARVTGIEIGPQGKEASRRYGIEVLDKPYRPRLFSERFDCIYSYACLEHIPGLSDIFQAARQDLVAGGLFFHVVPNSDLYFKSGDISGLVHEHVNYFTPSNAMRLIKSQGFRDVAYCLNTAGNELYAWGVFCPDEICVWPGRDPEVIRAEEQMLLEYGRKVEYAIANFKKFVRRAEDREASIGFYGGGFQYPVLAEMTTKFRYFDGDSFKHGKRWLKGQPLIESPETLAIDPVDILLIRPTHYFDVILKRLIEEVGLPSDTQILKLEDVLQGKTQ